MPEILAPVGAPVGAVTETGMAVVAPGIVAGFPLDAIEEWRPAPDSPHEVSSLGRVRNASTGRLLKLSPHKSGYLHVQLWRGSTFRTWLVHRLVAVTFLGPQPSPDHEVAHGDGNRHHNAVGNLRWALRAENMRDRDAHGRTAIGERNGKMKHSAETVVKARELRASGMKVAAIAAELSVPVGAVYGLLTPGRRKDVDGPAAAVGAR